MIKTWDFEDDNEVVKKELSQEEKRIIESNSLRESWDEKVEYKNNGDRSGDFLAVRISGDHYLISEEQGTAPFKGYDDDAYIIEFIGGPHKGTVVKTTVLWLQGEIPEAYKELLPDNAIIIKRCRAVKEISKINKEALFFED